VPEPDADARARAAAAVIEAARLVDRWLYRRPEDSYCRDELHRALAALDAIEPPDA
jgi:hypothetical protein